MLVRAARAASIARGGGANTQKPWPCWASHCVWRVSWHRKQSNRLHYLHYMLGTPCMAGTGSCRKYRSLSSALAAESACVDHVIRRKQCQACERAAGIVGWCCESSSGQRRTVSISCSPRPKWLPDCAGWRAWTADFGSQVSHVPCPWCAVVLAFLGLGVTVSVGCQACGRRRSGGRCPRPCTCPAL